MQIDTPSAMPFSLEVGGILLPLNETQLPVERTRNALDWARLKEWPSSSPYGNSSPFNIVDLFCGCGGLSLGACYAALMLGRTPKIALAMDANSAALGVYQRNFARFPTKVALGDVTKQIVNPVSKRRLKSSAVYVKSARNADVLLAGPPCQGHSNLNNRTRREDPRNDLYLVPALFAADSRPSIVLIENVPTVVHSDAAVVAKAVSILERARYKTLQLVVDLTALGIPQRRKRHLLVAVKPKLEARLSSIKTLRPTNVRLVEFLADIADEPKSDSAPFSRAPVASKENQARISYLFRNDLYDLPNSLRPPCHKDQKHSYVSMYGRLHPDQPAQTLTTGFGSMGQGRYVHPTRPRTITCHEAARIQGFPDFFSFDGVTSLTELREMIGNAVPPLLSAVVLHELLRRHD